MCIFSTNPHKKKACSLILKDLVIVQEEMEALAENGVSRDQARPREVKGREWI